LAGLHRALAGQPFGVERDDDQAHLDQTDIGFGHAAKHTFQQRLIADPRLRSVAGIEVRVTCEASVGSENVVRLHPHALAVAATIEVRPYGRGWVAVTDAREPEGAGLASGAVEDLA